MTRLILRRSFGKVEAYPDALSNCHRMRETKFDLVRRWLRDALAPPSKTGSSGTPTKSHRFVLAIGCVGVFLVALPIRLLYWQDASVEIARRDSTIQTLGDPYRQEASRMLNTGAVLFPQGRVDLSDARPIVHPPGYAILMAAFTRMFGDPDTPLRLTQILFACAQAAIIVLIAAELLPVSPAVIAGLMIAGSPHLAYYSIFQSPDSLTVFPILIAVYLIIRAARRPRLVTVIGAGVFVGLSCWLRSNSLLLAPFLSIVILLLFERGKRVRYAFALTAATLLLIAPITIHNLVVYGRLIPISIGGGLNLVEGIAEYDTKGTFELPVLDGDVIAKEVEWHQRPDYGESLYYPDGIERDQDRFARGFAVVRSNPGWFAGVVLRRMLFILRYNDFRFDNPRSNSPIAPGVSAEPNFGHDLSVPEDLPPVWSRSMAEVMTSSSFIAPEAIVSADEHGEWLEIASDRSDFGDQFVSAPIAVQKRSDYILALQIERAQNALSVKVRTSDPRITLASTSIPVRKKRKKAAEVENDDGNSKAKAYLHFATGDASDVRIVIANNRVTASDNAKLGPSVVRLGRAELFQAGATPYRWTHYPRLFMRAIQKNLYKTEWMWLLLLTGVVLLALARRGRALLILLAVPAYYLIAHSALHTEYRYILAVHYFLFVIAAVSLYRAAKLVKRRAGILRHAVG